MVMPKHPVKTVINSLSPQILTIINKSIIKNTTLQMKTPKLDKAIKKNLENIGFEV